MKHSNPSISNPIITQFITNNNISDMCVFHNTKHYKGLFLNYTDFLQLIIINNTLNIKITNSTNPSNIITILPLTPITSLQQLQSLTQPYLNSDLHTI